MIHTIHYLLLFVAANYLLASIGAYKQKTKLSGLSLTIAVTCFILGIIIFFIH